MILARMNLINNLLKGDNNNNNNNNNKKKSLIVYVNHALLGFYFC